MALPEYSIGDYLFDNLVGNPTDVSHLVTAQARSGVAGHTIHDHGEQGAAFGLTSTVYVEDRQQGRINFNGYTALKDEPPLGLVMGDYDFGEETYLVKVLSVTQRLLEKRTLIVGAVIVDQEIISAGDAGYILICDWLVVPIRIQD